MSTDVDASVRFYAETFGWTTEAMKMPDGVDYTVLKVGAIPVAGIMKHLMPGAPAFWTGAVAVDDVDAAASRAAAAGGKVLMPPIDLGTMGRWAGLADRQGALLYAWRANEVDPAAAAPVRPGVGMFCWEQLNTASPADAIAFYGEVFGWTSKPFSGGGDLMVFEAGAASVASVMQSAPGVPSHWLSYVVVERLAATYDRARQQGGQVMIERIDVPTVGAIGVIRDNVGAVIGVLEAPAG
ncbi:MAG TPA: VOC family protein [Kofleriaceae bacterium]|nr:VOC family protein [Kofleriaceae bacterium]